MEIETILMQYLNLGLSLSFEKIPKWYTIDALNVIFSIQLLTLLQLLTIFPF